MKIAETAIVRTKDIGRNVAISEYAVVWPYVFRSYSDKVKCAVTSVDTSNNWLKRTEQYLLSNKLNIDNLISWNNFISLSEDHKFDFILHDIGYIEMKLRTEALPMITKLVNSSGMIVLDNRTHSHFSGYPYNYLIYNGLIL